MNASLNEKELGIIGEINKVFISSVRGPRP